MEYIVNSFGNLIIPEGTTIISDNAFKNREDIKKVTIPKTVTNLGSYSFYNSGLEEVILQEGLTVIGKRAFQDCTYLKKITIPKTITYFGIEAFDGSGLEEVILQEGLTVIGQGAFRNCKHLKKITIPKTVTDFAYGAFINFAYGAFINSGLEEVILQEGLNVIGDLTFKDCKHLKKITIPRTVTKFGFNTFINSGLEEVILQEGLTVIGERAFEDCKYLKKITIPKTITYFGIEAFDGSGLEEVILQQGLTVIGGQAFQNCKHLKKITIPRTVTDFGFRTFYGSGLEEVILQEGLTVIGERAFEDCPNLIKITIPRTVTNFGIEAFYNSPIFYVINNSNINIPDYITDLPIINNKKYKSKLCMIFKTNSMDLFIKKTNEDFILPLLEKINYGCSFIFKKVMGYHMDGLRFKTTRSVIKVPEELKNLFYEYDENYILPDEEHDQIENDQINKWQIDQIIDFFKDPKKFMVKTQYIENDIGALKQAIIILNAIYIIIDNESYLKIRDFLLDIVSKYVKNDLQKNNFVTTEPDNNLYNKFCKNNTDGISKRKKSKGSKRIRRKSKGSKRIRRKSKGRKSKESKRVRRKSKRIRRKSKRRYS